MTKGTTQPDRRWRRPVGGLLPPHSRARVPFDPPLDDRETPLVVSRRPDDAVLASVQPNEVVIENRSATSTFYLLLIVPKSLAHVAVLPWSEIARDAGAIVRSIGQATNAIKYRRRRLP